MSIFSMCSGGIVIKSGSLTFHDVVPIVHVALRHNNIAVRWLIKAIQDHVVEAAVKCNHDTSGRLNRHLYTGHRGYIFCPGTRCIDDEIGTQSFGLACPIVPDFHARHTFARRDDLGNQFVPAHDSAMQTRRCEKSKTKAERFEHSIRYLYCGKCSGIEERLHFKYMLDGYIMCGDMASRTCFQKSRFEG